MNSKTSYGGTSSKNIKKMIKKSIFLGVFILLLNTRNYEKNTSVFKIYRARSYIYNDLAKLQCLLQ